MAKLNVFTLENLTVYDELIKNYVDTADAKSLKTVAIDGNVLKFYRVSEPVGETVPAYEIELPETDISGLLEKLTDATKGNVVVVGDDGTVTDGGVALTDLATNTEVEAINTKIGTVTEGKTVVEMIADAQDAATYDDTDIKADIEANANAIDAVEGVVTTLVGDDENKSVRTIANEELAKQLIAEGAKESLDTLEEIAAWIQSHPDDASAMSKAIDDLEALVGTLPEDVTATTIVGYIQEVVNAEKTRAEGVEAGLDTRLKAVEEAVGEGGTVETQITDAIADLDADVKSAEVEEGKGIQVQVTEVDGKVTTVAVTGNYDNSYDAKGAANTALTDAKTYADAEIAKTNANVTANAEDIEALQDLVGDGYEAIAEDDIRALFE